ncbi:MAG: hypothetical protein ABSE28_21330 [Candidatus Sulfotelmatobacter sp.]|jgi:hypothetical protein
MKMKMKWSRIPLLLIVLTVHDGGAQTETQLQNESKQVAAAVLAGPSMEKLEELCDRFGARLTGTAAHDRAAEWAAAQFRAVGIQDVKLEPITVPNGWQRGWAESSMYSPVPRKLHLESVSWTPSTPPGGVKGEVVVVSDISEAALRANAAAIKDRIVLVGTEHVFADGFNKVYPKLIASYSIFKALSAGSRASRRGAQQRVGGLARHRQRQGGNFASAHRRNRLGGCFADPAALGERSRRHRVFL